MSGAGRGGRARSAGGPPRRLRRITFVAIAITCVAIGLAAQATDVVRPLGLESVDVRFALRGDEPVPDDLVVVAIDDATFGDLQEQWPFPRRLHARALDRIKADGASVIAYDVQFTEPEQSIEDPGGDDALIRATRRNAPVVLSTTETEPDGSTGIFGGDDVVRAARARAGNTLLRFEDGVVRTVPHAMGGLESFAVVAAELATGRQVDTGWFTERHEQAWIDFVGGPGRIRTVSFGDVVDGRFPPRTFEDRIVVVGATATSLKDVYPTSTTRGDVLMSGPEIHANAIKTVLAGLPLQSTPGWISALIVAALAAAMPLAALRVAFRWALLGAVVVGGLYLAVAVGAFGSDLVLPVAVPLLSLALAAILSTAAHALLSASERQRTRDLFARFVPAAVVDDVLASTGDDLRLGGQRREGTVMFCDLRGFTTFAEQLAPDRVIEVLNAYLSEMSDAIMDEGGTLVAFMGDGIMAVFGAPLQSTDHADRAVRAAREMTDVRLPRFNAWIAEQGLGAAFRMGIGINSGPVMSGNVGSRTRVEYTAIGDTTNTAARLEGMTKDEGRQLLVAGSTHAAIVDDALRARLVALGDRPVRGRDATIALWTVPEPSQPSP